METFKPTVVNVTSLIKKIIPVLSPTSLKGDNGTIGTIGGSLEYTGAPYYAAITALKAGSDLSHVFCHTEAAIPIKSYSPELIVHPGFNKSSNKELLDKTIRWFKSMNAITVGPGLGRDQEIEEIFIKFANAMYIQKHIPIIYDADGLWFLGRTFFKLDPPSHVIITPNQTEYERLAKQITNQSNTQDTPYPEYDGDILLFDTIPTSQYQKEITLCNVLKNAILVKKGKFDIITNGKRLYIVKNPGSYKRTGGIGDILSGLISCYCGMVSKRKSLTQTQLTSDELLECCALGCFMCREASRSAYEKFKYSLTAPDIINEIHLVTNKYYNI